MSGNFEDIVAGVELDETVEPSLKKSEAASVDTGMVTVRFFPLGREESVVTLPSGSTVGYLLTDRKLSARDGEVLVNGVRADERTVLEPDSIVMYAPKIRGGDA